MPLRSRVVVASLSFHVLASAAEGSLRGRELSGGEGPVWTDLGAGCCTPSNDALFLFQGNTGVDPSGCQERCRSLGALCGFVNHGWMHGGRRSSYCSIVSADATCTTATLKSGPRDCGSCGDCGVRTYAYNPGRTLPGWVNRGVGCCTPGILLDVGDSYPLDIGYLSQSFLRGSIDLSQCQQMCNSFGDNCGFVNYGWVDGDGTPTGWCQVLSAKATCASLGSCGASGGVCPGDCMSCGSNCGVRTYAFLPPGR